MAYRQTINAHLKGSAQDKQQIIRELDALKADLTALRTSFLALTAKMDADATLVATDFGSVSNPPAQTFVA